jgi:hypothetical protein
MRVADESVRILPESMGVSRARTIALIFVNRLSEAEQIIDRIPEHDRSAQDLLVVGTLALLRGDAHASKRFDDTLRLLPGPVFELAIARSYFIANRVEEGLAYVDRAVKDDAACGLFAATTPAFGSYRDAPAFRTRLAAWKLNP